MFLFRKPTRTTMSCKAYVIAKPRNHYFTVTHLLVLLPVGKSMDRIDIKSLCFLKIIQKVKKSHLSVLYDVPKGMGRLQITCPQWDNKTINSNQHRLCLKTGSIRFIMLSRKTRSHLYYIFITSLKLVSGFVNHWFIYDDSWIMEF